jgi:manganese/zinc/iron transport system permease protein
VFWRWLKIATFDEGFAEALGIPVAAVGFGLVIAAALPRWPLSRRWAPSS